MEDPLFAIHSHSQLIRLGAFVLAKWWCIANVAIRFKTLDGFPELGSNFE